MGAQTATHWHAGAGLHGYPYQDGPHMFESYGDAVESMADAYDLGRGRRATLRRDGYLELNLNRDGNEYIEVIECDYAECRPEERSSAMARRRTRRCPR